MLRLFGEKSWVGPEPFLSYYCVYDPLWRDQHFLRWFVTAVIGLRHCSLPTQPLQFNSGEEHCVTTNPSLTSKENSNTSPPGPVCPHGGGFKHHTNDTS